MNFKVEEVFDEEDGMFKTTVYLGQTYATTKNICRASPAVIDALKFRVLEHLEKKNEQS